MIEVNYEQGNQNKMYEDALLGFILIDPAKMLEVSEILPNAECFRDPTNRAAYSIFLKLFNEDRFPADPALTIKELYTGGEKQHFETMDQAARYVNSLLNAPIDSAKFNPANYRDYAEQIKWEKDRGDIRNMAVETLAEVDRVAYDDREDFIGGIENRLGDITMAVHGKEGLKHISEMTSEIAEQIETLRGGSPLAGGVPTGIPSLDKTLNGLKGGEVCVLAARPACGKCLPRLTFIPTPKGAVQAKDLRVGDTLFNRFGQEVTITGVYPQPEPLEVFEVRLSDGRAVKCSEDHIWAVWRPSRFQNQHVQKLRNMTVREMLDVGLKEIRPSERNTQRKNRCRFSIPMNGAVEYPEKDFKIPPYVMGLFLGDGCKNTNKNFELSSGKGDEEIPYRVCEYLHCYTRKNKHENSNSWFFYAHPYEKSAFNENLKIADIDETYEDLLTQTYCTDKYIPEEYKYCSIEQRWELIRGLMDSDGTIHDGLTAEIMFSSNSLQLTNDVREVLFSLGIENAVSIQDRRGQEYLTAGKTYVRKSVEYRVLVNCPNDVKPLFFHLQRKKAIAEKHKDHAKRSNSEMVQIVDIVDLGYKDDMICFAVKDPHANPDYKCEQSILGDATADDHPDEHVYLCGEYVPTHNTTLSMQIAYNIATLKPEKPTDPEHAVLIFSLEMMEAQLVSRMISTIGRVNMQQFMEEYQHFVSRDGKYYEETYGKRFQDLMEQKLTQQYERTQIALKEIKDLPIYPTTESGLSPSAIKSMVMQKKRELERKHQKLSLIVIDYLQLMVPNLGKVNASRTEEVGDMSRKMKLLAKEFDVPVLLLAQLNRNADVTERPNLKDLRESGSIEQDADKVMFIWSESADKTINDFSEYRDDQAKREALRREQQKVIISVAKNRQGETGDCQVIFDRGFQTFVSQDDEHTSTGETFEEFALKYYQQTRTNDLFWPIPVGGVSEDLEAYRHLPIPEQPYLDNNGNVITMSNAARAGQGMGIRSVSRPQRGSEDLAELDRIKPSQPPIIEDDLQAGFEELPDEDDGAGDGSIPAFPEEETSADDDAALLDDVTIDDDEELDLDDLDMLDELSDDLLK